MIIAQFLAGLKFILKVFWALNSYRTQKFKINIYWNSNREFMQIKFEMKREKKWNFFKTQIYGISYCWMVFRLVASDDEKLAEKNLHPKISPVLHFIFFLFGTFTSLQTFLSMSLSCPERRCQGSPGMCLSCLY